jgi:polyisoprenoid-binding protein YceI
MADITTWNIDPTHSSIELAIKHMMITTVRGRFKEFSGTITANENNPDQSSVEVEIKAASLDTGSADRDAHLRSADFLDADTYPTLTFRSTKVEGAMKVEGDKFTVTGQLTIRGKSVEVTLECEYEGMGKDPWGGTRASARATTEIDRRDWGLQWNQALETGGLLVANRLKIAIEAQAIKQ